MAAIDFPNSPSLNQEFTVGSKTWIWDGTSWNAKATSPTQYNNLPTQGFSYYDECFYIANSTNNVFKDVNTGTSSGVTSIASTQYNRPGVIQMRVGTSAASRVAYIPTQSNLLTLSGSGNTNFETSVQSATALSSATQRYAAIFGFLNVTTTISTQTTGIFFIYDEGGVFTGAASPNWQVCIQNGTSNTFATTSVVVDNASWTRLRIEVSSSGGTNSVNFYINGNLVATPAVTNFPTAYIGPGLGVYKSIGTTGPYWYVDYIYFDQTLPTSGYR